jgi:hypothetical protein
MRALGEWGASVFPVRSYSTVEEFTNALLRKRLEGSNGFASRGIYT